VACIYRREMIISLGQGMYILADGPISWFSKKQGSVAISTIKAECMALSEATKETIQLRRLVKEMYGNEYVHKPTDVLCDNQRDYT